MGSAGAGSAAGRCRGHPHRRETLAWRGARQLVCTPGVHRTRRELLERMARARLRRRVWQTEVARLCGPRSRTTTLRCVVRCGAIPNRTSALLSLFTTPLLWFAYYPRGTGCCARKRTAKLFLVPFRDCTLLLRFIQTACAPSFSAIPLHCARRSVYPAKRATDEGVSGKMKA